MSKNEVRWKVRRESWYFQISLQFESTGQHMSIYCLLEQAKHTDK